MEVQIQSSNILGKGNPNSQPNAIPLTIFDQFAPDYYVPMLYAFAAPTPTNSKILEGVEKILVHFPTLTGRLGYTDDVGDGGGCRRPCVWVGGNGGGVLVVEAVVKSRLEDHLPLEPKPDFELLVPCFNKPGELEPLLQLQLNRFECGGLIVTGAGHHRVIDGQCSSNFITLLGKAVRGAPIDSLPSYDRSSLQPRCPPKCEFEHWGSEFVPISPRPYKSRFPPSQSEAEPSEIDNVILHFSRDFIRTNIKGKTSGKYSTVETLLAHIWIKITMVRGLKARERTVMRVSVNGRQKLRVPREYFGNLVLNAYANATVEDLITGGTEAAAKIIHDAIHRVDERYFRSLIDFGEINREEELVSVYDMDTNVLMPNLEGDSWIGFPYLDLDFGGEGGLCGFMLGWFPVDGSVVLFPSLQKDGGIDVCVGLYKEHAKILKQTSHILNIPMYSSPRLIPDELDETKFIADE